MQYKCFEGMIMVKKVQGSKVETYASGSSCPVTFDPVYGDSEFDESTSIEELVYQGQPVVATWHAGSDGNYKTMEPLRLQPGGALSFK